MSLKKSCLFKMGKKQLLVVVLLVAYTFSTSLAAQTTSKKKKTPTAKPLKSSVSATNKSKKHTVHKKQTFRIELKDAPVKNVISLMSRLSHKTYVYNESDLSNKKITVESTRDYTSHEALKILDALLSLNGLGVIDDATVSRIVKRQDLKFSGADVIHGQGPVQPGSMIIRAVPVNKLDAQLLRSNLSPLISRNGTILAVPTANMLLIKDTGTNVERLVKLIKLIQMQGHPFLKVHIEVYPLKHGSALKIAQILQSVFRVNTIALPVNQKIAVYNDDRTNSLILVGSPVILAKLRKLVARLDVPAEKSTGNIRVFRLHNLEAEDASRTLTRVLTAVNLTKKTNNVRGNTLIQATVVPDKGSNSLVIYADTSEFEEIETLINRIDIQRVQVYLEALIMEVRLDKSLDLGIDWQAGGVVGDGEDGGAAITVGGAGATGGPKAFPATSATGAIVGIIGGPISFGDKQFSTFNAFIKAVQKDSAVNILSNPQIMTLNKQEALIKVGEIIPTLGSSKTDINGNITQTIKYKEVGISLKVTPQVNENDILLKIDETSSNLIQDTTASSQNAITTLNRSLRTQVEVKEGQTLALGGLINDDVEQVETRVPCLGDIPFLGWFFRDTSNRVKKTNLLLFITPTIVKSAGDMRKVRVKAVNHYQSAQEDHFRIDVTHEFDLPEKTTKLVKLKNGKAETSEEESPYKKEHHTLSGSKTSASGSKVKSSSTKKQEIKGQTKNSNAVKGKKTSSTSHRATSKRTTRKHYVAAKKRVVPKHTTKHVIAKHTVSKRHVVPKKKTTKKRHVVAKHHVATRHTVSKRHVVPKKKTTKKRHVVARHHVATRHTVRRRHVVPKKKTTKKRHVVARHHVATRHTATRRHVVPKKKTTKKRHVVTRHHVATRHTITRRHVVPKKKTTKKRHVVTKHHVATRHTVTRRHVVPKKKTTKKRHVVARHHVVRHTTKKHV